MTATFTTELLAAHDVGGRGTPHRVEVLTYHVPGYARTRCLPHAHERVMFYRGDTEATAKSAARDCRQVQLMPYYRPPAPLRPWGAVTAAAASG